MAGDEKKYEISKTAFKTLVEGAASDKIEKRIDIVWSLFKTGKDLEAKLEAKND